MSVALLILPLETEGQHLPLEKISLPKGFEISIYAQCVPNARSLSLSPKGTLLVSTRESGKVYAVRDEDRDFRAERIYTLASGHEMPNGVAVKGGSLFVAEGSRIFRFDDVESRLGNLPNPR